MILDLPHTSTTEISKKIAELHLKRGEPLHARVLTLLISLTSAELEPVLKSTITASRSHPCRIIALVTDLEECDGPLCGQIRIGSDAGAGEIIVLKPTGELKEHLDSLVIPLLIPNVPVVAWWPSEAPENPQEHPLGRMAGTRITDVQYSKDPHAALDALKAAGDPNTTDMSWTRLTVWRGLLASLVDQPPHDPIQRAEIVGSYDFLPVDLMAAWLRHALGPDVPIKITYDTASEQDMRKVRISAVRLTTASGVLSIERPEGAQTIITLPHQRPQYINVPPRTREECLVEELQRLDADQLWCEVLHAVSWKD